MRPLSQILPRCSASIGLVLVCLACAAFAGEAAAPLNPSGFRIHRGTNLSHWLSQYAGQPRVEFITENDLRFIARSGFDHVRLPIDESELWLANGRPNEGTFIMLLRAIGWARAHSLRVIVDLHTVRAHHFNAENEGLKNTLWTDPRAQEHFLGLWRELSARLREQPVDAVAYEIMNEPVADDHDDWNRLVARTVTELRRTEPARVIVIGSNKWQGPWTFPHLRVPAGDKNIILSTHCYTPFPFTHYKANWVPLKSYTGPVHYPGPTIPADVYANLMATADRSLTDLVGTAREDWGPARIRQELLPAIQRAKELGLQLYCGEFGCLPTVPRTDRLAYYRDFVGVLEREGIAWANWEYKGDFGLFEWHGWKAQSGAPDVELLDALMQR